LSGERGRQRKGFPKRLAGPRRLLAREERRSPEEAAAALAAPSLWSWWRVSERGVRPRGRGVAVRPGDREAGRVGRTRPPGCRILQPTPYRPRLSAHLHPRAQAAMCAPPRLTPNTLPFNSIHPYAPKRPSPFPDAHTHAQWHSGRRVGQDPGCETSTKSSRESTAGMEGARSNHCTSVRSSRKAALTLGGCPMSVCPRDRGRFLLSARTPPKR